MKLVTPHSLIAPILNLPQEPFEPFTQSLAGHQLLAIHNTGRNRSSFGWSASGDVHSSVIVVKPRGVNRDSSLIVLNLRSLLSAGELWLPFWHKLQGF
jgi:hypothetical protein